MSFNPYQRASLSALFLLVAAQRAAGQGDTLRLGDLQRQAVARDPRAAQIDLLRDQTALRLHNLRTERLPSFGLSSQAQHQSEVTQIAFPGAQQPFKTTYDANAGVRVRLLDPSQRPRVSVERAQLAESEARVATATYALRQSVSDAFFAALLLEQQRHVIETSIADLDVQLRLARERVAADAALPGDAALLEAELLRRRQTLDEVVSSRAAAIALLADLSGRPIDARVILATPAAANEVRSVRSAIDSVRARPEYRSFATSRDAIAARAVALDAQLKPRLSFYGRSGFGRPGLNFLAREFTPYWLAGLQLEWSPFDWGTARREGEAIQIQRDIIASEERAFIERMRRAVITDLATIDRLEKIRGTDDEIIALRERILGETRLRYQEGVITAGEYVTRETDLNTARIARATHLVELEQARARFLTTLGLEVQP